MKSSTSNGPRNGPRNRQEDNATATLITGASVGLGAHFAKLFAKDGHNLVLVARRAEKLEELAQQLRIEYKIDCHVIAADLEDPKSPENIFKKIEDLELQIDHLVNNAGFGYTQRFSTAPIQQDLGMIEVNIKALVHLSKLVLPLMIKKRYGRILNIASTAAFQPGPYMATYYASKAFVNSFSEALNHELKGTGVTVTSSCPGPTLTEFAQRSGMGASTLFKLGAADAASVAAEAYSAMKVGKRRVIHGWKNTIGATLAGWTPNFVLLPLVAKLQPPEEQK